MKDEAIKFADWLLKNCNIVFDGCPPTFTTLDPPNSYNHVKKTTSELYEIFKNKK